MKAPTKVRECSQSVVCRWAAVQVWTGDAARFTEDIGDTAAGACLLFEAEAGRKCTRLAVGYLETRG